MTFPNMQHPDKKDMEQLGAIRNMLDKQEQKGPYDYTTPSDAIAGLTWIILGILFLVLFIIFIAQMCRL